MFVCIKTTIIDTLNHTHHPLPPLAHFVPPSCHTHTHTHTPNAFHMHSAYWCTYRIAKPIVILHHHLELQKNEEGNC